MKMTIELPDDLIRAVKLRAVHENRRIKDVMAEALHRGLASDAPAPGAARRRVRLPLVDCEPAASGDEVDADRVAAILLAEEAALQGSES